MIGIDTSKETDERVEECNLDVLVYKEVVRRRQNLKSKPITKTGKTGEASEAESPEKYRRMIKFSKKSKEGMAGLNRLHLE